jgi:hypothetical protein
VSEHSCTACGRAAANFDRAGCSCSPWQPSKVFLFDLAALDVAYRVISFIVLGLLLLASAWLWQRAQPRKPAAH